MSDDAKPMTPAEVVGWSYTLGDHWAARIGPLGHEVTIEGDRILATAWELAHARVLATELRAALMEIMTGLEGDDEDFGARIHDLAVKALAETKGES